jgi:hypothetical protein
MAEANAEVTGSLFNAATTGGNVAAQIFWHKTRMHWREREAAEDRAPSTDADSTSRVVIYLPDNDRDPGLTEVLRKAQEKYLVRRQRKGQ